MDTRFKDFKGSSWDAGVDLQQIVCDMIPASQSKDTVTGFSDLKPKVQPLDFRPAKLSFLEHFFSFRESSGPCYEGKGKEPCLEKEVLNTICQFNRYCGVAWPLIKYVQHLQPRWTNQLSWSFLLLFFWIQQKLPSEQRLSLVLGQQMPSLFPGFFPLSKRQGRGPGEPKPLPQARICENVVLFCPSQCWAQACAKCSS